MAGHLESFSSSYYQPESPKIRIPKPSGSGLTLVIPSLKNLKAQKSAKENPRAQTPIYHDVVQVPEKPKIQRPVKLKPLKEVLSKLIAQLKKKDDYAFFLHPVDVANVAGYADIVKRPMDLGTMGDKVARGRYRSLEEFTDDFRLVTGNAKLFNPPGSIYHTEADKIEAWGLDHIGRAAPTVIQYETDWNIDVEKDDEAPLDVVDDEDEAPAMDKERERSVSVMSQSQQPGPSTTRRGPRGPYKKQGQNPPGMSETLEPDGGLPGSKEGLGAFPVGSDWAKTMLALKRKGKRYKTKKERLRFEKEGPPMCADGSLDYSEMEDPFSVLSYFVPDGPSRPHLAPLFPTSTATTLPPNHTLPPLPFLDQSAGQIPPIQTTGSANAHPPPPRRRHWVISRNATWRGKGKEREDDYSLYESRGGITEIPEWQMPRELQAFDLGSYAVLQGELAEEMRRRGIAPVPMAPVLSNGIPTPAPQATPQLPFQTEYSWAQPQTPVTVNTPGTMSVPLTSVPGTPIASTPIPAFLNPPSANFAASTAFAAPSGVIDPAVENAKMLEIIKERLDCEAAEAAQRGQKPQSDVGLFTSEEMLTQGYWSSHRAAEAEAFVRDVVYGGVEGYAYVRSLAEFVNGRTYHEGAKDPEYEADEPSPVKYPGLGMPLAKWVEQTIVDSLTEGRHSLLRRTATELAHQAQVPGAGARAEAGTIASRVAASLQTHPYALTALTALQHIRQHKIDMGALIKTPDELFLSEEEWIGKALKEQRQQAKQKRAAAPTAASASSRGSSIGGGGGEASSPSADGDAMEVEEPEQTWAGVDADIAGASAGPASAPVYEQEGPEELSEVLEYVANKLVELDQRNREQHGLALSSTQGKSEQSVKVEEQHLAALDTPTISTTSSTSNGDGGSEDVAMRHLRLNLLALAKRAPLDTIARLPKDLVPEHIRNLVPTLGSS
ncbi:hypothetical protein D9619_008454 [Psilocybe cf. subviscida]|uniref:Bromo domain-containing protein n=1 Tax=Psilocybe cf. subviscida TaxID=2480587 RepID=A0A8H5B9M0_9AGAR|nr:hypothetical protein D9619_008454 [Psilocybe cf. subviscida]